MRDVEAKLDKAVKAGRLSKAEEQKALQGLQSRIDDLVNGKLRERFREHRGFGFRFHGFDKQGPPPNGFDRQGPPPPTDFDTAA